MVIFHSYVNVYQRVSNGDNQWGRGSEKCERLWSKIQNDRWTRWRWARSDKLQLEQISIPCRFILYISLQLFIFGKFRRVPAYTRLVLALSNWLGDIDDSEHYWKIQWCNTKNGGPNLNFWARERFSSIKVWPTGISKPRKTEQNNTKPGTLEWVGQYPHVFSVDFRPYLEVS